ncbi:hypothetical protein BY458DRAFT_519866 [Sporodiniella umbellata]|nr:hypothetical protein BY458DRAFT_519866 [Sporodiniella umbellata]
MKENKFVMGEEEEPPTVQEKQTRKQYTRHHVKRRSSGRVHVTKLAPMARANAHTDTEVDADDADHRPAMRRSQSQKSLHRLSSDRKGLGFTRRKSNASVKPPEKPVSNNPALLSDRAVAAPVEQTFNAVAQNLVVPKISYSTIPEPTEGIQVKKKQLLKSQFLPSSYDEPHHSPPKKSSSHENITPLLQMTRNSKPPSISRTQQKLMLQRQQAQTDDETSPIHPKNMQRLNKEWELVGKEYKCIKRYQDPVRMSLSRCLDHSDTKQQTYVPHLEQRQIAHRHHHLKTIALSRAQQEQSNREDNNSYGLISSFFDRVFHKV